MTRSLDGGIYNCHQGRHPRELKAEMIRLLVEQHPDFLLLQEANTYTAQLSTLPGYRLAASDQCGTALLVRHDVETKWANTHRLGFVPWLFTAKAGRPLSLHPRRAISYAVLDGWLDAASIHCVPSPLSPLRSPAYNQGMRRMVKWANGRPRRPLLIGGDWNKSHSNPGVYSPSWLAAQIGAEIHPVAGRRIDFPMTRRCTVSNLRAAGAYGSDHELILFTVKKEAS